MTYNTPELLSVGSAQNFVLAGIPLKFEQFTNTDDSPVNEDYTDSGGTADGSSW